MVRSSWPAGEQDGVANAFGVETGAVHAPEETIAGVEFGGGVAVGGALAVGGAEDEQAVELL
jgi:hypothetical protein